MGFGNPLDELLEEASNDYSIVRVNRRDDAEDPEKMTSNNLHHQIDEAYELLRGNGCESISVVEKSFGGQFALTYPDNDFKKIVLQAPAIGIGENNVEKWRSTLLEHAQTATDISADAEHLEQIDSNVKIIHGTEDQVVSIENSKRICEALPRCEFSVIEDSDHPFTDEENKLVSETTNLLGKWN